MTTVTLSQRSDEQTPFAGIPRSEYYPRVQLCEQGRSVEYVFLIHSGLVKLSHIDSSGKEIIVGLRSSDSLLGATEGVLRTRYLTSSTTLTHCTIARIAIEDFAARLRSNSELSRYVHELTALEVHSHMQTLISVASHSAEYRLATLLYETILELPHEHSKTTRLWQVPLKQWELAQLLAITPEHTNRVLGKLERAGLIKRDKRSIVINENKLISYISPYIPLHRRPISINSAPDGRSYAAGAADM